MAVPTQVPRVPAPQQQDNNSRLRRFTEIIGQIINSLLFKGEIWQESTGSFTIVNSDTVFGFRIWSDKTSYGMWGG